MREQKGTGYKKLVDQIKSDHEDYEARVRETQKARADQKSLQGHGRFNKRKEDLSMIEDSIRR